jgi:hypothetical protein
MIKNKISQTIEGIEYPSLKAIAEAYGLKHTRIYKRYQRGKRNDDLIPLKFRQSYIAPVDESKQRFIVGNVEYENVSDACRKLGVTFNKYQARIRLKWSKEEALGIVPRIDGRKTTSNKSTKRKKTIFPLIVFGKEYKSFAELSRIFGIKSYVLSQRINKYGKTPEEAILMDGKNKAVTVGNVEFESMAECARAFNIEPNTFYHLMKYYTVKQIVGIENRMTSKSIVYKNKWYPSRVALAEDYGITKNELYYRSYVCKLSFDEALNIPSNSSVVKSVFGSKAKLYVAEILPDSPIVPDGNKLYKVGVTQHSLSKRYKELPFECRTVFSRDGELNHLRGIEKSIKDKFEKNRVSDFKASDFDGFTEIYQLSQSELNNLKFLVKFDNLNENADNPKEIPITA